MIWQYTLVNQRNTVCKIREIWLQYMGLPPTIPFFLQVPSERLARCRRWKEKFMGWVGVQEIRKLTKGFSHVSHCRYHIFNALSAFIFEVFGNIYSALCGYPQECFSNNTLRNLEKLTPTRYCGVPGDNISRISASSKKARGLLKM